MIKATSSSLKIDEAVIFSSPALKLCPCICSAPKGPEWAQVWPQHTCLPPQSILVQGLKPDGGSQQHPALSTLLWEILCSFRAAPPAQHDHSSSAKASFNSHYGLIVLCSLPVLHQHLLWPHSPPNLMHTLFPNHSTSLLLLLLLCLSHKSRSCSWSRPPHTLPKPSPIPTSRHLQEDLWGLMSLLLLFQGVLSSSS